MKKNLFFALFACVVLAFVGCEPTPENKAEITVTPDSLSIGVGDMEKITATVAPVGTQLSIQWTSSDTTVVQVADGGIIIGTGVGTAVVTASAEGATPATCVVTVSYDVVYERFEFSDYGLFGMSEAEPIQMVPNTEQYVKFVSGDSAKCQIGYIALGVWDADIVSVGNTLTGAGNIMFVPMPMYVIVDKDPKWAEAYGQLVGGGGFIVAEIGDSIIPYVGLAGELIDVKSYGDFFKQDIASLYDESVEVDVNLYLNAFNGGAEMYFVNYDENYNTYNTATVAYAEFYDSSEGLEYYAEVKWLDYLNPGRWFGLAVNMDEAGYPTSVVEPYDLDILEYTYTNMEIIPDEEEEPAEASAKGKYYIMDNKRVHLDMDVKTILETRKMYKK